MRPLRLWLGAAFLVAQLGWIAYAHAQPWRYFAWAPNDYLTQYRIEVIANGHRLTRAEICARYRRLSCSEQGSDSNLPYVFEAPPRHLIDEVRQYEKTYGRKDQARISVYFRLNGHAEKRWRWPRA